MRDFVFEHAKKMRLKGRIKGGYIKTLCPRRSGAHLRVVRSLVIFSDLENVT